MKLNFRQGLASFQKDTSGNPKYLQASATDNFITLIVSPTPTIVTFAHGGSNYLQTFDKTVVNAWGPTIPGADNWLYFDIDLLTAEVTFGISLLTPVYSTYAPPQVNDQHWFDQTTTTMKVWSTVANKWQAKVRVFAGTAQNGSTALIDSLTGGSQAFINGSFDTGYILLDTQLRPLRISGGEYLTSDNDIRVKTTAHTAGVLASPLNSFIAVQAGENLPVMSAVSFAPDGTVILANSAIDQLFQLPPAGIVRQALTVNEIGPLTIVGEVFFDQWDWSKDIGKVVYYNATGKLTTKRPESNMAYRMGIITGKQSIIIDIDAETLPHVSDAKEVLIVKGIEPIKITDKPNDIGARVVTVSIAAATATTPGIMTPELFEKLEASVNETGAISDSIDAIYRDKADKNHTHTISEVINLATELANRSLVGHTHDFDDMPELEEKLDLKADLNHTHTIPQVVGLQPALDLKADKDHKHIIADVTGLQAALDNKSNIDHTHDDLYLKLTGGTLTGPLVLSGLPTAGGQAANKDYVDAAIITVQGFVGSAVAAAELKFPLFAPSSLGVPNYSFIDDVETGMHFSPLGGKALTINMSDNGKSKPHNKFTLYSGGANSAPADTDKYTTQGGGLLLSGSTLRAVGAITNIDTGEVVITTGGIATSPTPMTRTGSAITLKKSVIKDAEVVAGNIVIETATSTPPTTGPVIGGEISLKFGDAKEWTFKNTGALALHSNVGLPGQALVSQGPLSPATWQNVSGGGNNLPVEIANAPTQAQVNIHYLCTGPSAVVITLPKTPKPGDSFYITIANTNRTNSIALGNSGDKINGINEACVLDLQYGTVGLKFISTAIGWYFL